MTKEELKAIMEASKPVPYMIMGGVEPTSPQENANRAWSELAKKYGVEWDSIEPAPGKGYEFFMATPINQ